MGRDSLRMDGYPQGFEEDDRLRSAFIRDLTLQQLESAEASTACGSAAIPKTLVRYWHDPSDLPEDVQECIDSWTALREEGFLFRLFCDVSATTYIADKYDVRESEAFARCRHPAMRSDYFRMCFLLAEGGFYVDTDDVLLGDGWKALFQNMAMKLQPLCYEIQTGGMVPATEIWRADLSTNGRIFYVNNDPIATPAGHPILRRALTRATEKLLGANPLPEIQSTTGPGNLTAALAAHARDMRLAKVPFDFELIHDWESIAETRWELSYRNDSRNWRSMAAADAASQSESGQ